MKTLLALALFALPLAAAGGSNPCVPEGKTQDFTANPDLHADGIPTSAIVASEPEWYDQDLTSQDEMGVGNPLTIENKAGKLSGPNGKVVNGGLDGACIELHYRVLIRYKVSKKVTFEPGGIGASGVAEVWASRWVSFVKGDVCPC